MLNPAPKTSKPLAVAVATAMLALAVGVSACGSGGGDSPASASASKPSGSSSTIGYRDMTTDELRAMLNSDTAPVGDNARTASASSNALTAQETYEALQQRGFTGVELTADFDINGNYTGRKTIDSESDDAYPSYMARYTSDNGAAWLIYVNDGSFMAFPIGDGAAASSDKVVLSETKYVVQYDGDRNEFSDFALDGLEGTTGVEVARIDKPTLDSYLA